MLIHYNKPAWADEGLDLHLHVEFSRQTPNVMYHVEGFRGFTPRPLATPSRVNFTCEWCSESFHPLMASVLKIGYELQNIFSLIYGDIGRGHPQREL